MRSTNPNCIQKLKWCVVQTVTAPHHLYDTCDPIYKDGNPSIKEKDFKNQTYILNTSLHKNICIKISNKSLQTNRHVQSCT